MFYGGIIAAIIIFAIIALIYKLEWQGRKIEKEEQLEEILDDIYTANLVRDNLKSDPDYVRWLRKRFTRR